MNLSPVHCGSSKGYGLAQETWLICRRIQYLYVCRLFNFLWICCAGLHFIGITEQYSHNAAYNYGHMHFHFIIFDHYWPLVLTGQVYGIKHQKCNQQLCDCLEWVLTNFLNIFKIVMCTRCYQWMQVLFSSMKFVLS